MRRIAVWYILLNKRLFKKWSFLLILCMVPLLVAGLRLAAGQESGIVTIALCMKNPADELSVQVAEQLKGDDGVLRYITCETEEEARELVKSFQADAAWIFPEDLEESLQMAAAYKMATPVVTVVEREDNILLIFSREILSSTLYTYFSYEVYTDFVRDDLGITVDEKDLQAAYELVLVEDSLFRIEYFDGQASENSSYLLAPVRGILALWLVLCGFAASMYFIQDEKQGTFSWMPIKHRLWMAFGFHAVLLSDAVVILLIACKLAGVFTVWYKELANAVMFMGCALVFCNLVRLLCGTLERLGSCIPILLMGMAVLCPVFLNVNRFRPLQYLLPPFYYLQATHSTYHLYLMAAYILILTALCVFIFLCRNRKNKYKRRSEVKLKRRINKKCFVHNVEEK
ncbi:MAG: ABC transporter permease [Lachnospiraceae bacterium]|nr:ABC transporter permease [Lachnospiraceae bacterium]